MKFLILSLLLASSLSMASSSFKRTYRGQFFSLADIAVCEAEYKRITTLLDGTDGFTVLDGKCFVMSDKSVQLRFNYEAEITKDFSRYDYEFRNQALCQAQVQRSSQTVTSTGNIFVTAFCASNKYYLDYIDLTYSMIKQLKVKATFSLLNHCQAELKNISKALSANKMTAVVSYCSAYKFYGTNEIYYKINMSYLTPASQNMRIIEGRKLVNSACFDLDVSIERTFSDAGINIAHKFCSSGSSRDVGQEFILYTDHSRALNGKVKKYEGSSYATIASCGYQLEDLVVKFRGLKREAVYNYCAQTRLGKFIPTIHFIQK